MTHGKKLSNKNNKGKGKAAAKKEGTLNMAEQHGEYDEIYINTLELESYAVTKVKATHPSTVKVLHTLEGTMFINVKEAIFMFDTETIEANKLSALFVTTHRIPCTAMKEPTEVLIAKKVSRSDTYK